MSVSEAIVEVSNRCYEKKSMPDQYDVETARAVGSTVFILRLISWIRMAEVKTLDQQR